MDGATITVGETYYLVVIIREEAASVWRLLPCDNSHLRCPAMALPGPPVESAVASAA
jgi:hypothetical protein